MEDGGTSQLLRSLPSVRALLDDPQLRALAARHSRELVTEAARYVVERARERLKAGEGATVAAAEVVREVAARVRPKLRRVLNATGVVLHTNLGRAPLAPLALAHAVEAARGYANLELVLETGARGGRDDGVDAHLQALVGCERAFAVNNGAAAALLALAACAAGREVVVSRGELVEIGGGFRVPEVLVQSGCRLVEVGTTNRTRAADYAAVLGQGTGALLKVHRSNFALVGFTEEASLAELAALGRPRGIPLLYDQGTGDLDRVRRALADGADLVLFSGDKLLGGPQAGLVAGRAALVEQARRHPLARALRVDRLRLAALETTLSLWRQQRFAELPAARMLGEELATVRDRARALLRLLGEGPFGVVESEAAAGGGTRPGELLASAAVELRCGRAQRLAALLRTGEPAVVVRVVDGHVRLDARTLLPEELEEAALAVRAALDLLAVDDPRRGGREAGDRAGVFWEGDEAP